MDGNIMIGIFFLEGGRVWVCCRNRFMGVHGFLSVLLQKEAKHRRKEHLTTQGLRKLLQTTFGYKDIRNHGFYRTTCS